MPFEPVSKFLPLTITLQQPLICGLDEVGRGPWAGPLVTAAVILKKNISMPPNKDSKKLTEKKREEIFEKLQTYSSYGIGIASVEEIAEFGLTKATTLAFCRALEKLKPDYLLIDGNAKWKLPYQYTSIIKGDERVKVIACASIMAKVTRDRLMKEYAQKYPQYGFEEHKGYGTVRHQKALETHGPCEIHRKSFAPIVKLTKLLK